MRAWWKGMIAWEQIGIPVGLASAVDDGKSEFRTLHRPCLQPVQRGQVCLEHGLVEDEADLVKGIEISPGQWVRIEDDDLAAIAPDDDRSILIDAFVSVRDLPALAAGRGYYLVPSDHVTAQKPYVLLARTLRATKTVAVARFVARGSEYRAAIAPVGGRSRALLLRTLRPLSEIRPVDEIDEALAGVAPLKREETVLALELVERRTKPIGRVDLTTRHSGRVRDLVDAKIAGRQVVAAKPKPVQASPTLDLEDALRRSLRKAPRPRVTAA